jgi:hypothetical protein
MLPVQIAVAIFSAVMKDMLPVHIVYKGYPKEKQIHSEILSFVKRGGCGGTLHAEYVNVCLMGCDMVLYQKFGGHIESLSAFESGRGRYPCIVYFFFKQCTSVLKYDLVES